MLGNVSEWCADFYRRDLADTKGNDVNTAGKMMVIRGGAFDSFPPGCRCAARTSAPVSYQFIQTGFRVVMDANLSVVK